MWWLQSCSSLGNKISLWLVEAMGDNSSFLFQFGKWSVMNDLPEAKQHVWALYRCQYPMGSISKSGWQWNLIEVIFGRIMTVFWKKGPSLNVWNCWSSPFWFKTHGTNRPAAQGQKRKVLSFQRVCVCVVILSRQPSNKSGRPPLKSHICHKLARRP